jgi:hypothetical protein
VSLQQEGAKKTVMCHMEPLPTKLPQAIAGGRLEGLRVVEERPAGLYGGKKYKKSNER